MISIKLIRTFEEVFLRATPQNFVPLMQNNLMESTFDKLKNAARDVWSGVESALNDGSPMRSPELALPVDVVETADAWLVMVELPGVPKESVRIALHEGQLTIKGTKAPDLTLDILKYQQQERAFGDFIRTVPLPESLPAEPSIKARFEHGVLIVTLSKEVAQA